MSTEVLTLKEVSKYLKAHPDTVYRLARNGEIPCFKIGKNWRFRRESVDQWFTAKEKSRSNNN